MQKNYFRIHFVIWITLISVLPDQVLSQSQKNSQAQTLFTNHCGRCHGMKGGGGTGPSLQRPNLIHAPDDESLAAVIAYGISGTGMPGSWMLSPTDIADLVVFVRELGEAEQEVITGDISQGKVLFEKKGACLNCHIVEGEGRGLGPELTRVGNQRGPTYLQEAIQHPGKNKVLDANGFLTYLVVEAESKTGELIRGVRINEDSFTIQIRSADNHIHSFQKKELKSLRMRQEESLMPSFESTFSPEEINHLTAYLTSLTN